MGWRFRRSVQVIPGVRLNFSKRGVATSVGVKGAHVTLGKGRVTSTVGVPGTGISYSATAQRDQQVTSASPSRGWLLFLGLASGIASVCCYTSGLERASYAFFGVGLLMIALALFAGRQD